MRRRRPIILILAGLAALALAVRVDAQFRQRGRNFGNIATADFESGGGAVPFLRARGLLADDSPGPTEGETFKFRDNFLVAGRIRLGTLLDLIAMYLDTLEIHYDLFDEVHVEPDLLPGETDPDRIASVPIQAAADSGEPEATDDEADSEEVEALRKALLEVRSAVALDQR